MVRVIKEHDERLNELLDIAQELFFNKGYEATSVNDIIEKAGVAKGTFYHYFRTKDNLLDKLVARWTRNTLERVNRLVMAPEGLNAIKRLNAFFITIRDFKVENIELMRVLMQVLYREENLILRHKMFKKTIESLTPLLVKILEQGEKERVFHLENIRDTAELVFSMALGFSDIVVHLLFQSKGSGTDIDALETKMKVYQRSIERILGADPGSLAIVDRRIIKIFTVNHPAEAPAIHDRRSGNP
jgi:AcrR family transcriptional regulator